MSYAGNNGPWLSTLQLFSAVSDYAGWLRLAVGHGVSAR